MADISSEAKLLSLGESDEETQVKIVGVTVKWWQWTFIPGWNLAGWNQLLKICWRTYGI